MIAWVGSFFLSEYKEQYPDYVDPDSPEQTIKYVFLEKLKYIEESSGRNTNRSYTNETNISNLRKQLNQSNRTINNLYRFTEDLQKRLDILENKLSKSIILEPYNECITLSPS